MKCGIQEDQLVSLIFLDTKFCDTKWLNNEPCKGKNLIKIILLETAP